MPSVAAALGEIALRDQTYQRMRLWSISDYFENRPCLLPPMADAYTGKRIDETLF